MKRPIMNQEDRWFMINYPDNMPYATTVRWIKFYILQILKELRSIPPISWSLNAMYRLLRSKQVTSLAIAHDLKTMNHRDFHKFAYKKYKSNQYIEWVDFRFNITNGITATAINTSEIFLQNN